jgi:ribonucleoside-diphosphate reductase alpha chain
MASGGVTHEKRETSNEKPVVQEEVTAGPPKAVRKRLADERLSVTHKFSVAGHDGYITVGLYEDGQPGEIFIRMAKEGSTVSGLMDSFATAISIALQHGVPLRLMCEKFAHTRFEPSGWSGNPEIGFAKSIMDYIFRWMHLRFLTGQQQALFDGLRPKTIGAMPPGVPDENGLLASGTTPPQGGIAPSTEYQVPSTEMKAPTDRGLFHAADAMKDFVDMGDAPSCHVCGAIMTRNGSCYRCMSCGSTSGCS